MSELNTPEVEDKEMERVTGGRLPVGEPIIVKPQHIFTDEENDGKPGPVVPPDAVMH